VQLFARTIITFASLFALIVSLPGWDYRFEADGQYDAYTPVEKLSHVSV
jgi:hypothetical protein